MLRKDLALFRKALADRDLMSVVAHASARKDELLSVPYEEGLKYLSGAANHWIARDYNNVLMETFYKIGILTGRFALEILLWANQLKDFKVYKRVYNFLEAKGYDLKSSERVILFQAAISYRMYLNASITKKFKFLIDKGLDLEKANFAPEYLERLKECLKNP